MIRVLAFLGLALAAQAAEYTLILGEPAVKTAVGGRAALVAEGKRLALGHSGVVSTLHARGFQVLGTTEIFLHAVYVNADPSQEDDLRAIPGVLGVIRNLPIRKSLDKAVQLVNGPAAWNLLNGVSRAGLGIKIGIIDTGIESTHPAFQDSTLQPPAGYPICTGADCAFTNSKVIVARSYVKYVAGLLQNSTSVPNPATDRPDDVSPRDRDGHGTAVAMAAAGVTNSGPSDTITGVAPKAFLGNYKVFGSPGVNDYASTVGVNLALQDAFADGMDIVVLSSGSPAIAGALDTGAACGVASNVPCNPSAVQADNAVKAGMLVVAAAGNYGDSGIASPLLQSVTAPAIAPNVLAVAASTNAHLFYSVVTVAGIPYRGNFGNGIIPAQPLTAPLIDMGLVSGDPSGCTTPSGLITKGAIAIVARGNCTFNDKVQNTIAGGAVGVIFVNNPGDNTFFSPGGLGGTPIPGMLVGYDDGQAILSSLADGVTATLDPLPRAADATANQMASFSSRGPAIGTYALKPEITAPGTGIYLAGGTYDPNGALYSTSGYVVGNGTSFSTPIVAGAAALVKQARPTLSAAAIRSSIINTATQDLTDGIASPSVLAAGAGKLNIAAAINNNLIISPATISFGVVKALPATQKIQLTNIGSTPLSLSVNINRRRAENNAKTSIDLPNFTVPPGLTSTINLSLTGSVPTPGIYEGTISIQGAAGPLTIPYVYIVGDGIPDNISALYGDGDEGVVNSSPSGQVFAFKVIDKYGLPVAQYPVTFGVAAGDGKIQSKSSQTDSFGIAYAIPILGTQPGTNIFYGSAGPLSVSFTDTARLKPTITAAVNAGSFENKPVAPGSYIAIFGTGLSDVTQVSTQARLPLVLGNVTVSFDVPGVGLSAPGRVYFVSPGQVTVQVPWELAGQSAALIKVSVGFSTGGTFPLLLTPAAPAAFEYAAGKQLLAAALDENYSLISPANPAQQGRVVQIYCNGLGAVTNTPISGEPASASPLSQTTSTPTVTIGGKPAQVLFSGLTPTAIGLYQLNVVVPATGPGIQPVVISLGTATAKQTQLVIQ